MPEQYTYELYHHGVKGMRWGIRRTPKQLGHDTSSSKKRRTDKEKAKTKTAKEKTKSVKDMTDEEIVKAIERKKLEDAYRQVHPETVSRGRKFAQSILDDVLIPGAIAAGRKQFENLLNNYGDSYIKKYFKDPVDKDSIDALTKTRDKLKLKKEIDDLKKGPVKSLADTLKDMRDQREVDDLKDDDLQKARRDAEKAKLNYEINKKYKMNDTVNPGTSTPKSSDAADTGDKTPEQSSKKYSFVDVNVRDTGKKYVATFTQDKFKLDNMSIEAKAKAAGMTREEYLDNYIFGNNSGDSR